MENLIRDGKTWPMILDMTKDECKRTLRALELSTYSNVVSVFRAQGELTKEKRKLLNDLQSIFSVSLERHRAEIRRAVNDEILTTIADTLAGPNTGIEWSIEGRRLIPLLSRLPPQVAYTALATQMAQLYCGINSKFLKPCDTANYQKNDDLGADSDITDSEEETDGLRFINESLIPQQYNCDQGSYSTLPHSVARLAKDKIKEVKAANFSSTSSPPSPSSFVQSTITTSSSITTGSPITTSSSITTSGVPTSMPSSIVGSGKRKRKRSTSTDTIPHPPPPPPSTQPPTFANSVPSFGVSTGLRQLSGISSSISGSSMKITVTGGITKTTYASTMSTSGTQGQKVILVSTSAGSVSGGLYQRSISVPILKSSQCNIGSSSSSVSSNFSSQSSLLKNVTSTVSHITTCSSLYSGSTTIVIPSPTITKSIATSLSGASLMSSGFSSIGASSFIGKIRPRIGTGSTSSVLPTGSTPPITGSLPLRIPRQRSNSLILHTDSPVSLHSTKADILVSRSSSVLPDSANVPPSSSLNFVGSSSLQIRSSAVPQNKSALQGRQDGPRILAPTLVSTSPGLTSSGTIIGTNSIISNTITSQIPITSNISSQILDRNSVPTSLPSSQGLYVVSTNSGTITVVTRTVSSGQGSISTPRVMSVNTMNPRTSIASIRTTTPSSVVSLSVPQKAVQTVRVAPQVAGQLTTSLRPVMSSTKNNVIVVHKGAMPSGCRPVGLHGIKDFSGKFIAKTVNPTASTSNVRSGSIPTTSCSSGLLSGTLVVKPGVKTISPSTLSTTSIISTKTTSLLTSSFLTAITTTISNTNTNTSNSKINTDASSSYLLPGSDNVSKSVSQSTSGIGTALSNILHTSVSNTTVQKEKQLQVSEFLKDDPSSSFPDLNTQSFSRPSDLCTSSSSIENQFPLPSSMLLKGNSNDMFSSDSQNFISSTTVQVPLDNEGESMESTIVDQDLSKEDFSPDDNEWLKLDIVDPEEEGEEEEGRAFGEVEGNVGTNQDLLYELINSTTRDAGTEGHLRLPHLRSVSSSSGILGTPLISPTPFREGEESSLGCIVENYSETGTSQNTNSSTTKENVSLALDVFGDDAKTEEEDTITEN